MRKPRRSVFLGAAKRLSRYRYGNHLYLYPDQTSQFCCDCIQYETEARPNVHSYTDEPELDMFADLFRPENCQTLGWWKTGEGGSEVAGHDYESRLLALLLCWAMLEPKNKRKRR